MALSSFVFLTRLHALPPSFPSFSLSLINFFLSPFSLSPFYLFIPSRSKWLPIASLIRDDGWAARAGWGGRALRLLSRYRASPLPGSAVGRTGIQADKLKKRKPHFALPSCCVLKGRRISSEKSRKLAEVF